MKLHKISLLGYLVSALIIGASSIRWLFIWVDVSQAIVGAFVGFLVGILAYIYDWMRKKDEEFVNMKREFNEELAKLRKQYQALISWWTKNEKEDIITIAKGGEIE